MWGDPRCWCDLILPIPGSIPDTSRERGYEFFRDGKYFYPVPQGVVLFFLVQIGKLLKLPEVFVIMGESKRRKAALGDKYGQEENLFPYVEILKRNLEKGMGRNPRMCVQTLIDDIENEHEDLGFVPALTALGFLAERDVHLDAMRWIA